MLNRLITNKSSDKHWFQNDELHRTNGPAVEWADGTKQWYQNGELHREDGPAIEWPDGTKHWFQNDELHRTDGPAIECENGDRYWFIKNVEYDFNKWLELVDTYTEAEKTLMRLQHA